MSLRIRLLFNFPTYKVLAISIVSVIVGVASIALSVTGLINQIWGHYVATGIWSGAIMTITGFFGIASAQTRGVCVVKTFMLFSLFSCVVSIGAIALSIGGLIYNSKFYFDVYHLHPNTRLIHGLLLGTATIQTLLSVVCAVICTKHICCSPKQKMQPYLTERDDTSNQLHRGEERASQSSSAPLMSRQKRTNGHSSARTDLNEAGSNQLTASKRHSRSGEHHSRNKNPEDDGRHKHRSSDRSSSLRGRRHSAERGRDQRTSRENRSPDRYADKPILQLDTTASVPRQTDASIGDQVTIELESHLNNNVNFEQMLIDDDLEGLPPYEEVIKDNEFDESQGNFIDIDSVSLSHDTLDCTRMKEISAEQEALLCLSAALEPPVTSLNSEISNRLSDPLILALDTNSLSANSNTESENILKLSTDLVISSQRGSDIDEQSAPNLAPSERQALRQKYNIADPDPQGVVYKEFSRKSDIIKESINEVKPKRSKSFQHAREREFARGHSLSSRHLSFDKENKRRENTDNENGYGEVRSYHTFRPLSKSFSQALTVHSKPPPKPPRTSSLRQANGINKVRPKSATLPYSQGGLNTMQVDEQDSCIATDNATQSKPQNTTLNEKLEPNTIQPPKFRYPRPKLTSYTFQEVDKPSISRPVSTLKQKQSLELQPIMADVPPHSELVTVDVPPHSESILRPFVATVDQFSRHRVSESCAHSSRHPRESLTLPISVLPNSTVNETLKSPTDYSAIPLKEILLKGQPSDRATQRLSDLERTSSTCSSDASSVDSSSGDSLDDNEAGSANNAMNNDRDSLNLSDTEGKPMYSFLL